MREKRTPAQIAAIKNQVLEEYEKTQVIAEISENLNIPITTLKHYFREMGLKSKGGNLPLHTLGLEEKIRKQYILTPNYKNICEALGLNYSSSMRKYFKTLNLENIKKTNLIWIDAEHVECSKCSKKVKYDELETLRVNSNRESKISYCRECRTKQSIVNNNSSLEKYLSNRLRKLKARAKEKNIPFDLTLEILLTMFMQQAGKCFYTDQKMVYPLEGKSTTDDTDHILSIDKIVPEKGYVKSNIVLCCNRINTIKTDMNLDELKEWFPDWFNRIEQLYKYQKSPKTQQITL